MSTVCLENKTILITGAAGFIGSNLVKRVYQEVPSATVIGVDNMNAYYDVTLKEFRLNELTKFPTFTFIKGNIAGVIGYDSIRKHLAVCGYHTVEIREKYYL